MSKSAKKKTKSKLKIANIYIPKLSKKIVFFIVATVFIIIFALHIKSILDIFPRTFEYLNTFKTEAESFRPTLIGDNITTAILIMQKDKTSSNNNLKAIYVFSLNKKTGEISSISVNPHFIVTFNEVRTTLNNIFNVDKNLTSLEKIINTLQTFLGLKIDRYLKISESEMFSIIADWNLNMQIDFSSLDEDFYAGEFLSTIETIEQLETNNTSYNEDLSTRLWLDFFNTNFSRFKNIFTLYRLIWDAKNLVNLMETNFTRDELINIILTLNTSDLTIKSTWIGALEGEKSNFALGSITPYYQNINKKILETFFSASALKEQARIEVFNATLENGLASKFKRLISNKGLTVVKDGNYFEQSDETIIFVPNSNSSQFIDTLKILEAELSGKYRLEEGGYLLNHSGDIVVVLGKDIINFL